MILISYYKLLHKKWNKNRNKKKTKVIWDFHVKNVDDPSYGQTKSLQMKTKMIFNIFYS